MMYSILIVLSSLFTIAATVPYMVEIVQGKAKPRVASWFTWTAIQAIGAIAAFSAHQTPAAIYTLFCALECGAIVVLGIKHGDKKFETLDIVCLSGAIVGLFSLAFLKAPSLAIIVLVATDFLGAIPTLKHAWLKPHEETWVTYALFGIGSGITLLIADFHILTAIAYPMYLLLFDSTVTCIILLSPHRTLIERPEFTHTDSIIIKDGAMLASAANMPSTQSTQLIDTLVTANADLWSMMPKNPWLQGLVNGGLSEKSLIVWAQQTRHLCFLEIQALEQLRKHNPPEPIDAILAQLIADTDSGAEQLLELLKSMGAIFSDDVYPPCLNYGYYLQACADESLVTGLVAMCASERAYFDTCSVIIQSLPKESRLYDWIVAWSSDELHTSLIEFERSIEAYVGMPVGILLPDLEKVVRQIAHCELDFWDMCWKQESGPIIKLSFSPPEPVTTLAHETMGGTNDHV